MCQCKTGTNQYTQSISDGEAKKVSLAASLESLQAEKIQLASDLKSHKSDREAAKVALADAKACMANHGSLSYPTQFSLAAN